MDLEAVYQSKYIQVAINPEQDYLQATWLQQPTSESFREQIRLVVDLALARNIKKALFDVRQRAYLEIADQNWLVREIVPLFVGTNLRFAYVVSETTLEVMDTYRIQVAVENNPVLSEQVIIKMFLDPQEAQTWLFSKVSKFQ
jgi:hypothetical protein